MDNSKPFSLANRDDCVNLFGVPLPKRLFVTLSGPHFGSREGNMIEIVWDSQTKSWREVPS